MKDPEAQKDIETTKDLETIEDINTIEDIETIINPQPLNHYLFNNLSHLSLTPLLLEILSHLKTN